MVTEPGSPAPLPLQTRAIGALARLAPGLALVGAICVVSYGLRLLPHADALSIMIIATLLGALVRNSAGLPAICEPGVIFASKVLLRLAIVLLGLQLTLSDLFGLGEVAVMLMLLVPATIVVCCYIGRLMGVSPNLSALVAMGVGICGASAIAATREVVNADNEDVGYSLMCITLFGTVSMLAYPVIAQALGLSPTQYGIWVGASVHEVAQVVGAAFQMGEAAGETGVVVKLARILLLAPALAALIALVARRKGPLPADGPARVPLVPGFIMLFMGLVVLASLVPVAPGVVAASAGLSQILMACALAGLGLGIDFRKLIRLGWRPLALGGIGTTLIAGASLAYAMLAI